MSTTLAQLRALFAAPDREYRPVPWWLFTGAMAEPEMRRQLDLMREQGIYEFFVFPIYGMETPYLSEEFLRQVGFALDYGRRHGVRVWIYDEYNWPSGVCAGYVLRDHPWTRYRALKWALRWAENADQSVEVAYEGDFVAARAIAADGSVTEIVPPSPGAPVNYSGPLATVVVFYTAVMHVRFPYAYGADWAPQEESYVDVLNPAAIAKFIEYTHEVYARHFKRHMPEVLPGFFTDEPGIYESLPFTGDLFEAFRERYGYDLQPRLHELLLDVGDFRRTRYDYWRLTSERVGEAYHLQIRKWCDDHGVHYTGHLPGEETLWEVLRYNGDIWEASRWMSIPGIDMLANMTGYGGGQPHMFYQGVDTRLFHVTPKLIASTCRFTGAKRMLSEAFGVSTFGLTAAEMRWGANWQAALGVNLFNDNTFEYSLAEFRKWMISGKHFTTPWFQRYRLFSDYCARLCRMHAEGEMAAEVAVLYPRTATFCLADGRVLQSGGRDLPAWQDMQQAVGAVTEGLVRWQWDFDFLYEQLFDEAAVEGDALVVRGARYRAVILPAAVAVPALVARRLGQFARAGGLVLAVGSLPEYCPDDALDPRSAMAAARTIPLGDQTEEMLDAELARVLRPPLRVKGAQARLIVSSRRRYPDGDLFFVANMGREPAALQVDLAGGPACELWDLDSGMIFDAGAAPAGEGCRAALDLAPGQGVFLSPRAQTGAPAWAARPLAEQLLGDEWEFKVTPGNALRLAVEVRFDRDGRGEAERWYEPSPAGRASAGPRPDGVSAEEASGLRMRERVWAWLPTRESTLPVDLTPEEAPEHWMRARVLCCADLDGLRLVVDGAHVIAGYLDGERLPDPAPFTLWDHENLAYALPPMGVGEHWIVLRARTSKYHSPRIRGSLGYPLSALDPVVLLGDFALESEEPLPTIGRRQPTIRTGDWTSQGYLYFAGVGEYRQVVRVGNRRGRAWLDFGACRDVLEVEVNGRPLGARGWPPYRFEVTGALHEGDNEVVVRVFSTLGNLIWEHYSHAPRVVFPTGLLAPCKVVWTE